MTAVTVELPDALHRVLAEAADARGLSVAQLLAKTAADRVGDAGADRLRQRAARGSAGGLRAVLDLVPHAEPDPWDRLGGDG